MKTAPLRVLIAEDEAAHATAIRRAFEAGGSKAEIKVVGTLREFRQCGAKRPPDIAVVDLNLPDGKAMEVMTYPPEDGPFPVLMMTSYGNEQVAVEAMKAGALDYVVKSPEAFADLPRTVAGALREWKLLTERKQAEETLRASQESLRQIFEASPNVTSVFQMEGQSLRRTWVSPNLERLFGYTVQ